MDAPNQQAPRPQLIEMPTRKTRRKRLSQLMPELRRRIPALFDLGCSAERIGDDLGTSRADVLEELISDLRRKGPQRASNVVGIRRTA
jgi:biotin operon repressor